MSYFYAAYGLILDSEIPLPELIPSSALAGDLCLRFGPIPDNPLEIGDQAHCYQNTEQGMYLYWQGVGSFWIQAGSKVLIDLEADLDEDRLRLFILGAVMGVILHQRDLLVMHASAVAIQGAAVLFMGDKRWGKSTMAAALHAQGHSLIADDVVALEISDSQPIRVRPAFPQIKLWPDAVAGLGQDPDQVPRLAAPFEKRNHLLDKGFMADILPLEQIYVLGQGEQIEIVPLSAQEMIRHLLRNSYVARFGQELLQPNGAAHFQRLTTLAQQVPLNRLLRPADLDLLPAVAKRVEVHVRGHDS